MSYPLSLPAQIPLLTVTHPSSSLWVIELHHGEDNRLTGHFIDNAILPALDHIELAWRNSVRDAKAKKDHDGGKGALIIIGKRNQDKFFSNGFHYPDVVKNPAFIPNTYNVLFSRLLSYPIPTIAAINGHVFAAGLITALSCDYRVIRSDKQRRVHFGAPLPVSFTQLLKRKVPNPQVLRKLVLEGHRFTPSEMLEASIVDYVVDGDSEAVLKHATELAEQVSGNARAGVWGLIKKGINDDILGAARLNPRTVHAEEEDAIARARL
ncbi:ClpP/crotonase-like domain-containing protein [Hysterangium stoloniferum]|nr:ClpP/crotonase-like domain-containing protein [Hysterangium stoloniferum]